MYIIHYYTFYVRFALVVRLYFTEFDAVLDVFQQLMVISFFCFRFGFVQKLLKQSQCDYSAQIALFAKSTL